MKYKEKLFYIKIWIVIFIASIFFNKLYSSSYESASFVVLSTSLNGILTINDFNFQNNNASISVIQIDDTVGVVTLTNSSFTNEAITSINPYINIQDINSAVFRNITFTNEWFLVGNKLNSSII